MFAECVNPRLRKIRDGLDELDLPSDELLNHAAPRLVYGMSLVNNLADYLLGIDDKPDFILPASAAKAATEKIAGWWMERWCAPRAARPEVVERVESHTLVHPIRHGARVRVPEPLFDGPGLFDGDF